VSGVCCSALEPLRQKSDQAYIIHYMDDLLLSHPNLDILQNLLPHVLEQLPKVVLLQPQKSYKNKLPFHIWGRLLRDIIFAPQK
jgi:hypothetical protein